MTDDRSAFTEARDVGLRQRHEQRLDRVRERICPDCSALPGRDHSAACLTNLPETPTYTAAEVRVLTDAALLLGRREAAEEIAAAIVTHYIPVYNVGGAEPIPSDPTEWDEALHLAATIARDISKGDPT